MSAGHLVLLGPLSPPLSPAAGVAAAFVATAARAASAIRARLAFTCRATRSRAEEFFPSFRRMRVTSARIAREATTGSCSPRGFVGGLCCRRSANLAFFAGGESSASRPASFSASAFGMDLNVPAGTIWATFLGLTNGGGRERGGRLALVAAVIIVLLLLEFGARGRWTTGSCMCAIVYIAEGCHQKKTVKRRGGGGRVVCGVF